MEFILYFIFGLIVSVINWIFIISKDSKNHINVCISLFLGTVLWPAIFIGMFYKVAGYINRNYESSRN